MTQEDIMYLQMVLGKQMAEMWIDINDKNNPAKAVVQQVTINGESYSMTLKEDK